MSGAGPPQVGGVDVEALLRQAHALVDGGCERAPTAQPSSGVAEPKDADAAAALRSLLIKDPHRIRVREDYHVLRTVIRGGWGSRESPTSGPLSEEQVLLLALVLAARLPLDGLLLAAQALFHALPDTHILALLRPMTCASPTTAKASANSLGGGFDSKVPFSKTLKDDTLLALHHGLLASAAVLVPHVDLDGEGPDANPASCRRPGQVTPAGPALREAVVDAVLGPTVGVTLAECRATSHRTKSAFKMLHTYLCTVTRWRHVPAELDEILMLVWTGWEVPLPGVREVNELVLAQLHDLALQSASWPGRTVAVDGIPEATAAGLHRLRDLDAHRCGVLRRVSWRVKDKYLLLKVLVPRVGRAALIRDLDDVLMDGLLLGMADSHLASAATAVYRAVLDVLNLEEWSAHCMRHLTEGATSSDRKLAMNVLNYWVGPTVKALPDALPVLLNAMSGPMRVAMADEDLARASHAHAAYLHLLKIGRKDGFWDPADPGDEVSEYWSAVEWGLHHADSWVRGLALSAACMSARPRQPVSARELHAALRFVECNARADDTRLRHTVLEALGWLLMRLRNSLRPLLARPQGDSEDNGELAAAARFLRELHRFVLDGLQPGTNYQRRVTCLGVYAVLLCYLFPDAATATSASSTAASGSGLKKGVSREPLPRSAVLARHLRLGSADSRRVLLNCIMDPADDVRNRAAEILAGLPDDDGDDYDHDGGQAPSVHVPTWGHVLALCNSQLFFQAESGAVLGSVLYSWNEDCVQPADLVSLCESQLADLRSDVLAAASGGSPLHGLLGLLRRLLPGSGPGPRPGRRQPGRWAGTERRLLRLLEDNVELCLSMLASRASSDSVFAPSFAEMGEAIDSMVSSRSAVEGEDDPLSLTLSPAHQLVLNCIWLNLKASCALASDLVEVDWAAHQGDQGNHGLGHQGTADALQFAERCARLPLTVLTRCRHKGAIESAGTALQQVVKALTEQPDAALRSLPHKLLMEFLHLLLEGSTAKGTSVSRRSAGMAILVHRIVLGDQQPDKPMLHECISCLFALLENSTDQSGMEESQHDLPQTQALHFLRTLVADATLRVSMSPYLGQAALCCFRHLNSPVWSIRNASLQLHGALVPKIVGQGKSAGEAEEEDTLVGCISFGDLIVRFYPLCKLLLNTLQTVPTDGAILSTHANLMPALSLLSRLSVPEITPWSIRELQSFKLAFLQLLSSPISVVRSLAAKAFARFTPLMDSADSFEQLLKTYLKQPTENGRLGVLTAMKLIRDHLHMDGQKTEAFHSEEKRISALIQDHLLLQDQSQSSFASQAILLSIMEKKIYSDPDKISSKLFDKINMLKSETQVGIFQWIAVYVKQIITRCRIEDLPEILDKSLGMASSTDVQRIALLHAHRRLNEKEVICVLQEILNVCLDHVCDRDTFSNYETFHLLNLILKVITIAIERHCPLLCDTSTITKLLTDFFSCKYGTRCEAIALPVVAGLNMFSCRHVKSRDITLNANERSTNEEILYKVINSLKKFRCPEKYDETFRLAAATALQFSGTTFIHLFTFSSGDMNEEKRYEVAATILETGIQLLQDEDGDIREEASKFVTSLSQDIPKVFNSFECLVTLFTPTFLLKFFKDDPWVMLFLWELLSTSKGSNCVLKDTDVENPFDHGSKNIFAEDMWIVELAGKLLRSVVDHGQKSSPVNLLQLSKFLPSCKTVQEDIHCLKTLSQDSTCNKVREEWRASAIHLLQKRLHYRLEILKNICNDMKSLHLLTESGLIFMDLLEPQERSLVDNFSFYL